MNRRWAVTALTGVMGFLGWPSPAETCSPPQPGFDRIFPTQGTLLPRNAHIFARGTAHPGPVEAEMFEVDFVVALPVTTIAGSPFSSFHLTTIAEFAAGLPIRVSYTDGVNQVSAQYQVSPQEDLQPPGDVQAFVTGTETRASEPGLCEPGGDYLKVFVPEVLDDWGLLFFRVVRDDGRTVASRFPPGPSLEGLNLDIRATDKTFCYRVHARDMGGNESISDLLCWPTNEDAGVADRGVLTDGGVAGDATLVDAVSVDAGLAAQDGGSRSLIRDNGCDCRSARSDSVLLWFMFFAVVFASAGRRRRKPS